MAEMEGCTLLENLRSKVYGLPVVAASGLLDVAHLQSDGFDGFIDKPRTPGSPWEMIAEMLPEMNRTLVGCWPQLYLYGIAC